MIALNIKADLRPLQRAFVDFRSKQAPFAMALALTGLAKGVEQMEDAATLEVFERPTPFTQRAFAIQPATKSAPIAIVFPKDIQGQYLAPYVVGGPRFLGSKKGMLVPVEQGTNQYGNLPRNTVSRLLAKPGVFKGTIVTKKGKRISGIWQRTSTPAGRRTKGAVQPKRPLKLLIAFDDTTTAPKHFDFEARANAYLRANAARQFDAALRKALTTARR